MAQEEVQLLDAAASLVFCLRVAGAGRIAGELGYLVLVRGNAAAKYLQLI
jgi:hypothetical protein